MIPGNCLDDNSYMDPSNVFHEMTKCSGCPCLNTDYESGCSCNLEYDTDLYWTDKPCPHDLVWASFNCELGSVVSSHGAYVPVTVMARKKRTDGLVRDGLILR